jgi:hypothetical protein
LTGPKFSEPYRYRLKQDCLPDTVLKGTWAVGVDIWSMVGLLPVLILSATDHIQTLALENFFKLKNNYQKQTSLYAQGFCFFQEALIGYNKINFQIS